MNKIQEAGVLILFVGLVGAAPGIARAVEVTPQIRLKAVNIPGRLQATAKVQGVARSHLPALLRCYKSNLTSHPGEVGPLVLRVRILPTGRISEVKVRSSGVNAALRRCVVNKIKTWTFPSWKEPQRRTATLRLVFQLSATPHPQATIRGGISARLVAGTVETHLPGLRTTCLKDKTGKGNKKTALYLQVSISARGVVRFAGVTGKVKRRGRRCLTRRMRRWQFPPSDQSLLTRVRYPLRTASGGVRAPRPRRRR